jgi:hypothetical protein
MKYIAMILSILFGSFSFALAQSNSAGSAANRNPATAEPRTEQRRSRCWRQLSHSASYKQLPGRLQCFAEGWLGAGIFGDNTRQLRREHPPLTPWAAPRLYLQEAVFSAQCTPLRVVCCALRAELQI